MNDGPPLERSIRGQQELWALGKREIDGLVCCKELLSCFGNSASLGRALFCHSIGCSKSDS